jgi:hypothetical protein
MDPRLKPDPTMGNSIKLLASLALAAGQAGYSVGYHTAASVQATAQTDVKLQNIKFEASAENPIITETPKAPDFDSEVLTPLQQAQAKAEAERQRAAARSRVSTRVVTASAGRWVSAPATPEAWTKLRFCEAGGIYTRNSGNGYYGAYQFDIRTWNNWGGYARADLAPPAVQDAKAQETYNRRGWTPWPSCAKRLGLLTWVPA